VNLYLYIKYKLILMVESEHKSITLNVANLD
jgi:hypothetical protein